MQAFFMNVRSLDLGPRPPTPAPGGACREPDRSVTLNSWQARTEGAMACALLQLQLHVLKCKNNTSRWTKVRRLCTTATETSCVRVQEQHLAVDEGTRLVHLCN